MLDKKNNLAIAISENRQLNIRPEMLNRHGIVTGATGTGKTVTLQTLAESFSQLGIPVFMADVKGDLSGLASKGSLEGKAGKRVKDLSLKETGWEAQSCPVVFWDVNGKKGHHIRATISDLGPGILSRLLGLNDVQSGVLQIVFRIADDNGWLLLDLKDLRSMLVHVSEEKENYTGKYGQIAPASIGAIQRAILRLEDEGAEQFFCEPALDIKDLLQKVDSKGVINILDATNLINTPLLYSCLLLWLLSEFFERLPEAGDLDKPRLVFFFDEAHLLFDGISPVLLQKIEQIVRLIRSRGVGIFFVSQNPADIPDTILGQLGNRVQHALRAFTPKDQKSVKAAAQAFRPNPAFSTEQAIGELGIGEALVSFLDENGTPQMVERSFIIPPQSKIGPINNEELKRNLKNSPVAGKYDKMIDRESAYEILEAKAQEAANAQLEEEERKRKEKEFSDWQKKSQKEERDLQKVLSRQQKDRQGNSLNNLDPDHIKKSVKTTDPVDEILGNFIKHTSRAVGSSVGKAIGKSIIRGLLGGLAGKK